MTTTELLDSIEAEIGDTENSTSRPRLLQRLTLAHTSIVTGGGELNTAPSGRPNHIPFIFPWAISKDPAVLVLEPATEDTTDASSVTDTFTITTNSATKDLTGYYAKFDNHPTTYKVSSHSGTTVVLDTDILEAGSATEDVTFAKLEYEVTAELTLNHFIIYTKDGEMECNVLAPEEFKRTVQKSSMVEAYPKYAAIVKQSGNTHTFRFSSYPEFSCRAEIDYIPVVAALTEGGSDPIIPEHFQEMLVHLTTFYDLRLNDDDRAASHYSSAKAIYDAAVTEAKQILHYNDMLFGQVSPVGSLKTTKRSITQDY